MTSNEKSIELLERALDYLLGKRDEIAHVVNNRTTTKRDLLCLEIEKFLYRVKQ